MIVEWSKTLDFESKVEIALVQILSVTVALFISDFRTTTNGRAGGLLARTGSLSGHPSKQQPRSTLLAVTVVPATLRPWQSMYVLN
ncbi:hypothetical protein J6590_042202 [Homalodisca vitripennis]|nr:hypothetical protein J6590_042201 [Homalodisca vitripennis]KAG8331433.1 hypothetical protein J6590_042202 [Homalodisca vitripennis]